MALGHTATGLVLCVCSLSLSLFLTLCLPLSPIISLPPSLSLFLSLVDPFSLLPAACCTCSRSGSLVYTSHHGLGSGSVGGATFATLGFVRFGLTAHSAFHCCCCSLFKCKFRRLEICKPKANTEIQNETCTNKSEIVLYCIKNTMVQYENQREQLHTIYYIWHAEG